MQSLMRIACIGYMIFLTALLLASDPTRLVGREVAGILEPLEPYAHFLSFFVLAVLVLATRWPIPRWMTFVFLVGYGGLTELVQGLVWRHPDWKDWVQDVAGIAAGTALCWTVAALGRIFFRRRRNGRPRAETGIDEWEVLRSIAARSAAEGRSWWQ